MLSSSTMACSVKALSFLSLFHFVLGILAVITGLVSMKVSPFYNGVFGMGLWIGGWMILTALAGFLSSRYPGDYCKIGLFLGSCLVAVVILSICSIILGTVVITHYRFESMVTRSYYKDKGTFGEVSHEDYFKPEEVFESRRKEGRIGLAVYGCLLAIQISNILVCCFSIYVCRDLCRTEEVANNGASARRAVSAQRSAGSTQLSAGSEIPDVPSVALALNSNNWVELGFPLSPQRSQDNHYYSPCKLPNYGELYPEGIVNTGQDRLELESRPPDEPPPEYTPVVAPSPQQSSSLPGSSVDLPSPPSNLLAEDRVFEHSRARLESSLQEHLLVSGPPPEYPGTLRLPTLAPPLHPGDSFGPCSPYVTASDSATSETETHTGDAESLERDLPSCSTPSSISQGNLPSEVSTLPNTVTASSTETFGAISVLNTENDNGAEHASTNVTAIVSEESNDNQERTTELARSTACPE